MTGDWGAVLLGVAAVTAAVTILLLWLELRRLHRDIRGLSNVLLQVVEPIPQHVPDKDSPFCVECGAHVSDWDSKPCVSAAAVRVLRGQRG